MYVGVMIRVMPAREHVLLWYLLLAQVLEAVFPVEKIVLCTVGGLHHSGYFFMHDVGEADWGLVL